MQMMQIKLLIRQSVLCKTLSSVCFGRFEDDAREGRLVRRKFVYRTIRVGS
jgi:hypothetical protein